MLLNWLYIRLLLPAQYPPAVVLTAELVKGRRAVEYVIVDFC